MPKNKNDLTFLDQVAISSKMQQIARMIDAELSAAAGGKRVPFSLYTWGGHRTQYVSNTDRDQIKVAMQETLDRWGEDDGPVHKTAN